MAPRPVVKANPRDSFDAQNEHCATYAGPAFDRCMNLTAAPPRPAAQARPAAPGEPAAEPEPVIITVTRQDLLNLPVAPGEMSVQPAREWVLVNMPTIVYTQAQPQTFDITILDTPVQVHVEPVNYAWDFGEGSVVHTTDPGAPYPNHTVSHTYENATAEGQSQSIELTTTWAGEFSVAGGPWEPVDGAVTTSLTSEPFTVDEARSELTLPTGG